MLPLIDQVLALVLKHLGSINFTQPGRKSVLKQLDQLLDTIGRFKEALRKRDKSGVEKIYEEYQEQILIFERRLFTGMMKETDERLLAFIWDIRNVEENFLNILSFAEDNVAGRYFREYIVILEIDPRKLGMGELSPDDTEQIARNVASHKRRAKAVLERHLDKLVGRLEGIRKGLSTSNKPRTPPLRRKPRTSKRNS
jgi:hypothetical protein